jgi:hypothetical protein
MSAEAPKKGDSLPILRGESLRWQIRSRQGRRSHSGVIGGVARGPLKGRLRADGIQVRGERGPIWIHSLAAITEAGPAMNTPLSQQIELFGGGHNRLDT